MNDYKELLEHPELCWGYIDELRSAIKQLVKERDAAVAYIPTHCGTCNHNYVTPVDYSNCDIGVLNCNWEWRGVQDE